MFDKIRLFFDDLKLLNWPDILERALATFWQALVPLVPAAAWTDFNAWVSALIAAGGAAVAYLLSVVKNVWLQRRALKEWQTNEVREY